ncbi:hypothetical protein N7520_006436 [Penicillium odoratum]|uniref:uncharacterized protein n=1 Tax=Penicillium odoratum TaxID=1167516 RepID=UPI002548F6F6|nr:uncharacterized protein N7520_006436 [Penicillium odoratum]KAJ5759280.1 hypothetical protein N7520_006436 [Penicillium odoratum]
MTTPSQYAGLAATWTLETGKAPPTENMLLLDSGFAEAVYAPDHRSIVDRVDIMDGGKYRSIVKLQMSYEGIPAEEKRASMGTGWLIRPDLLVTAGHCVYDHSGNDGQGFGRVNAMLCHIGYNGRDSLKSPYVQSRFAKKIVTTGEWIDSQDNRHRDVAFVQLDKPFTGHLGLFSFAPTPMKDHDVIGIVGYPGDNYLKDSDGIQEMGAQMYEEFQNIKYNREENALKMLQYRLSTFGGQCGSPVLRKTTPKMSIGAHCYGENDKNSASPIGEQEGVDYNVYISTFVTSYPTVKDVSGVTFVDPRPLPVTVPRFPSPGSIPETQEDFFDALKSIVGITPRAGKAASSMASPLLGPLGGPVSAIAGAALLAAANAAAAELGPGNIPQTAQGKSERAILAEASLQAVLGIYDPDLADKIFKEMTAHYSELASDITNIAPQMTPLLKDSALRLAVSGDYLRKVDNMKLGNRRPISQDETESVSDIDAPNSPFLEALLQPTRPVDGEEGFFDGLGSILRAGAREVSPFVGTQARIGLQLLNDAFAQHEEDRVSQVPNDERVDDMATTLLNKRAILAEAALRALMKFDKLDIARISETETELNFGPERFFDGVKSMVQLMGSAVSNVSPKVIDALLPIAADALSRDSTKSNALSPPPQRKKQPSFIDLLKPVVLV